jgi:hypothetical protein
MATFYSRPGRAAKGFAAALIFFYTGTVFADEPTNAVYIARTQVAYLHTQSQYLAAPDNSSNAWIFARACYDRADFAANDTERADLANQGISACRDMIVRLPKSAPAHYYLAMNSGQLARTELLGALSLVKEMEREFKIALDLDEHFDYAGAERNLGLLYLEAPPFASIGNKRKAKDFLERALKRAPDFPENHMNLVEAYLQWDDAAHAKTELAGLDALWPKAQTNFAGQAWEIDWTDWIARRDTARKKLAELSPAGK